MAAFKALILGPPGGGKGTLSKRLVRDFGFAHFSAGDALRAEIAAGSAIGKAAEGHISRGELVPDDVVCAAARRVAVGSVATTPRRRRERGSHASTH